MDIITYPHNKLRVVCTPVSEITETIKILLRNMETITRSKKGIGLAANQVGEPIRVVVAFLQGKFWKLINPEIVESEGEELVQEGCLSIPGTVCTIKRAGKIKVKALNKKGKVIQFDLTGLDASCIQHEIDHLNGILILDRAVNNANSFDQTRS